MSGHTGSHLCYQPANVFDSPTTPSGSSLFISRLQADQGTLHDRMYRRHEIRSRNRLSISALSKTISCLFLKRIDRNRVPSPIMRAMSSSPIRVLAVIPPMTQLNTPYPSTAYLTGFLRSRGIDAVQEDIALGLVLELFSPAGLAQIRARVEAMPPKKRSVAVDHFFNHYSRYLATISPVVAFLQGRDPSIGHRIAGRNFLPEGPRFAALDVYIDEDGGDPLAWAFGALGVQDRARHLATLYLNDLADVLREAVDPRFEFVRYAESLALSQPTFEPLARALAAAPNLVDRVLQKLTLQAVDRHQPKLVLVSVPFPGAVYAAFRMAQASAC